jgi:dihydroflavonol-4-reductase
MKVLLTGANGFLASNIARELLFRGFEVRAMVRQNANLKTLQGLDIEIVRANLLNQSEVINAAAGCGYIIHAAADTSQYYNRSEPLFPTNVEGTINVVQAAKTHLVQRLIFVSTANTIGLNDPTNANNLSALYTHSGYAMSKLKAEEIILHETETSKLDVIIVNPTFLIGPYDSKPSSGRIFMKYQKMPVLFFPKGGKNFVDVKNASIAICNAMNMGKSGNKYVLAGENLGFKDFFELIDKEVGRHKPKICIPSSLLLFAGKIGSLLRWLGLKAELDYYNARILLLHEAISGTQAENDLLMPKTDVKKSIREALTWFKENGMADLYTK